MEIQAIKNLKNRAKLVPLTTLLIIACVSVVGVGALARYLFMVPAVIDLTVTDNPYAVALIRDSAPVELVEFVGSCYEDDLIDVQVETLSYYLDTLNNHAGITVYAYIDVEGLDEGTIEVLYRENEEWIVVDTLTPEDQLGSFALEYTNGIVRKSIKFRFVSGDPTSMELIFKFFGEDAPRV